jgi:regulator of protease activity HflC (stomatin/prohibitin superfamily)
MTDVKLPEHRQAQNVAVFGLVLQLACLATLVGLALWSGSHVIAAVCRLVAVGIPIWFVIFLVFKQLRRVAAEQLETTELKRAQAAGSSDAIFEVGDEDLLIEQNRLRWLLKWVLPGTTVVLFLYLLLGQFIGWSWTLENAFSRDGGVARTEQPMLMMWFVAGVGVLSFWYSRYSIALARTPHWRLLRAGAVCMAGNALTCLLVAVAFMAGLSFPWAEPLVAYVLRAVLIVLGIEFAANFVLDFYRPHTPGVLPRPSFESRLLALFAEPGGIAKSIADAINYQFGFEVSSTWFYQLLQRWLFPIAVFACVVVLLLSSITIVDADEQAVIERFGRIVDRPAAVLEPGIHFKWPYPIDVVRRAPVRRVRELVIGESSAKDDDPRKAILWTESHDYVPELMLMVGAPRAERRMADLLAPPGQRPRGSQDVPVALLMFSVPIEYRVKDVRAYLYNYREPERIMEAVAYQFLSDYAAGVDSDSLMGPQREELNRQLRSRLQERLDECQTGIEIVFAATRGVHPPAESGVAEAFLGVITAQTQKAATINAAEGEAQKILIAVAGTESRALTLDQAIRERDALQSDSESDPAARQAAAKAVEDLLLGNVEEGIPPLSGQAAVLIAEAKAKASNDVADAAAKVRAFKTELVAFNSAPELFKQRKWMEIWTGLDRVRKYLIAGDPANVIIEYETEQKGGLDEVLNPAAKP